MYPFGTHFYVCMGFMLLCNFESAEMMDFLYFFEKNCTLLS